MPALPYYFPEYVYTCLPDICVHCVGEISAHEGQKRMWVPEIQMIVIYHVGAGNQTQVLWKHS